MDAVIIHSKEKKERNTEQRRTAAESTNIFWSSYQRVV